MAVVPMGAQQARLQIPCPVMLVSGTVDRDSIEFSFRNKGKFPIQQLSVGCAPAPHGTARNAICHTESGLFFPATQYSITFPYTSSSRVPVVITAKAARLGDGNTWVSRPSAPCRPLRVSRGSSR